MRPMGFIGSSNGYLACLVAQLLTVTRDHGDKGKHEGQQRHKGQLGFQLTVRQGWSIGQSPSLQSHALGRKGQKTSTIDVTRMERCGVVRAGCGVLGASSSSPFAKPEEV